MTRAKQDGRIFVPYRRIAYVDWSMVAAFGRVDELARRLPTDGDIEAARRLLADRLAAKSYQAGTDRLALFGPVLFTTALTLAACDVAPGRDHAVLVWARRELVSSVVHGVEEKKGATLGEG